MSTLLLAMYAAYTVHREPLAGEVPPPDPQGVYRTLTGDNATSTSRCIGSTDEPLCAVETVLACQSRDNAELCRAGLAPEAPAAAFRPQQGQFASYRFDKVEVLGYPHRQAPTARVGDMTVQVSSAPAAGAPAQSATYFVGKRGDGWRVLGVAPVTAGK